MVKFLCIRTEIQQHMLINALTVTTFHILIVFKPISLKGIHILCFSLLSNTISISDDVYVVKRNMTGAPEFTADFE
jgi:hypothetical protein